MIIIKNKKGVANIKKMNVLFVANKNEIGGATKSMLDMIKKLDDKCNITVLTPIKGKVYDFCLKNNIRVAFMF